MKKQHIVHCTYLDFFFFSRLTDLYDNEMCVFLFACICHAINKINLQSLSRLVVFNHHVSIPSTLSFDMARHFSRENLQYPCTSSNSKDRCLWS